MSSKRWIKVYMMDDDVIYKDSKLFHLWMDILLHTNHTDYFSKGDLIKRGQCILSLNQVSDRIGMSKPTVQKCLKKLEECGKIELDIRKKGTIVTVLNWDKYQNNYIDDGLPSGLKLNHQLNHQLNPNKNKEIDKNKRDDIDLDRSEISRILETVGLEDYTDDVYLRCKGKKINNLKNYVLKIAEGIKKNSKKSKTSEAVTPEEKEEFKKLMESLN